MSGSGSILRKHRLERDFTITPNAPARNHRLSLRARGLLWFLLTQPDGFPVNAADLARDLAAGREEGARAVKEGREAVETAIAELADHGHIIRRREQNARGHWVTFTDVYELPVIDHATDNGSPVAGQAPTDNGSTGAGSPVALDRRTVTEGLTETPNGVSAQEPERWNAGQMLRRYIDTLPCRPPGRECGQLAKHLGDMSREHMPEDAVWDSLEEYRESDLHPSVLPSLVAVRLRGGSRRRRQGTDWKAITAQLEAAAEQEPPPLRAIGGRG